MPAVIPEALLATTPPMVQAMALAGSGPELPAVRSERGVRPYDRRAGLDARACRALAEHLHARPVTADVDQDVLALRLSVQRGAGGAEDDLTALARA